MRVFQQAKDELYTLTLSPLKGASETLLRCSTSYLFSILQIYNLGF